jgi:hypothetical protein
MRKRQMTARLAVSSRRNKFPISTDWGEAHDVSPLQNNQWDRNFASYPNIRLSWCDTKRNRLPCSKEPIYRGLI